MQTLKNSAIAVLVLTVMYGAYVSLTTPPEPLPPEVEGMLVDNDAMNLDVELPESLDLDSLDMGIETDLAVDARERTDDPQRMAIASGEILPGSAEFDLDASPMSSQGTASAPAFATLSDASMSLGDGSLDAPTTALAPVLDTATNPSADLSSLDAPAPRASDSIAMASSNAGGYQSTGLSFQMPDPEIASESLSSSGATTPEATTATTTPIPDSKISLLSATSEPSSSIMTGAPETSVSQASIPPEEPIASDSNDIGFDNAIRTADQQYADGKVRQALATLSLFYSTPNLSGEQRADLLSRLDPLAREVIYSRSHILEQPRRLGDRETLANVAERYEVPWQLLANINGIRDPGSVLPGTELKVVRGPFRAQVDLSMKELTLFLGDLYAGRFPIEVGNDPEPRPGTFTIQDKQTQRTYYDASGSPVAAGDPANPYGGAWMDLGGQLCIHGSPNSRSATNKGCISLAGDYAGDLYGILSQGSSVTIRR